MDPDHCIALFGFNPSIITDLSESSHARIAEVHRVLKAAKRATDPVARDFFCLWAIRYAAGVDQSARLNVTQQAKLELLCTEAEALMSGTPHLMGQVHEMAWKSAIPHHLQRAFQRLETRLQAR